MDSYAAAREKFGTACDYLAAAPNVKQGLFDAYMSFHPIQPHQMPEGLRTRHAMLRHDLTCQEEEYPGQGALIATLRAMDEQEANSLAREILAIYGQLSDT